MSDGSIPDWFQMLAQQCSQSMFEPINPDYQFRYTVEEFSGQGIQWKSQALEFSVLEIFFTPTGLMCKLNILEDRLDATVESQAFSLTTWEDFSDRLNKLIELAITEFSRIAEEQEQEDD